MRTRFSAYLSFVALSNLLTFCASVPPTHHSLRLQPIIKCDARTKPPTNPSFQDCQDFLWDLSIKAHKEPPGAYKWYSRIIEPCSQCVELPTIIHFGNQKCAAIIDSEEKHEKEASIFGLRDLWQALSDVVSVCWLREKHNGIGFPDRQTAWAGFIRGPYPRLSFSSTDFAALGSGTVRIIDLSEGWPKTIGGKAINGTARTETA